MAQSDGAQLTRRDAWRQPQLLLCVAEATSDILIRFTCAAAGKQVCVPSLLFRHRHRHRNRKGRKEFFILFSFIVFYFVLFCLKNHPSVLRQRRRLGSGN